MTIFRELFGEDFKTPDRRNKLRLVEVLKERYEAELPLLNGEARKAYIKNETLDILLFIIEQTEDFAQNHSKKDVKNHIMFQMTKIRIKIEKSEDPLQIWQYLEDLIPDLRLQIP